MAVIPQSEQYLCERGGRVSPVTMSKTQGSLRTYSFCRVAGNEMSTSSAIELESRYLVEEEHIETRADQHPSELWGREYQHPQQNVQLLQRRWQCEVSRREAVHAEASSCPRPREPKARLAPCSSQQHGVEREHGNAGRPYSASIVSGSSNASMERRSFSPR